ncbi:Hsp20/alpha crystallin family protein [Aeromicrobium wangtongii]|uniref:Hsp20/alpha crystallin family protein n=1 Tax=Aeromicrobium wangtongii TaxID=2969247 RepID=A0ABY5M8B2_9ACTN|nr:Hsp20/alpha crystallin family protein [Aeromicrobium wangtongii]MCD9197997.1 Hsp20/alpha crystallin family protein [Aeromicrobium wangtongii]UUP12041.1 Hsp20/alpha crystallin family protein [Aeromicrobium wangtongii]
MAQGIVRRSQGPFTDLVDWFETEMRHVGVAPSVPVEDYTEDDQYVVRAELPGVDPDKDVTVTVEGDVLTIHGERREEKKDKNRQEHRYGSFTRQVRIPRAAADDVKASYADGILEVRVPLKASEGGPQKIVIERSK